MDLVDLAACGDLEGVKEVLADPTTTAENVNSLDKDSRSTLHYACLNDDSKLLEILLRDKRVDMNLRSPKGDSCLHMASLYASLRAMKMLLEDKRGVALLCSKNEYDETPLHLCAASGDKGAAKAAKLLLNFGDEKVMLMQDRWKRGPLDVAVANSENHLVVVFQEYLDSASSDLRKKVKKISEAAEKEKNDRPKPDEKTKKKTANLIFAGLGGALQSLKKVSTTEKHMFSNTEGQTTNKTQQAQAKPGMKSLSKLIDFPPDFEEVTVFLKDDKVDANGTDSFGLTALHKFSSWNKVEFIDILVPKLSKEELNTASPDGKTALHLACEMASVSSVSKLVSLGLDKTAKDNEGRTPMDILNSGNGPIIARLKKALDA